MNIKSISFFAVFLCFAEIVFAKEDVKLRKEGNTIILSLESDVNRELEVSEDLKNWKRLNADKIRTSNLIIWELENNGGKEFFRKMGPAPKNIYRWDYELIFQLDSDIDQPNLLYPAAYKYENGDYLFYNPNNIYRVSNRRIIKDIDPPGLNLVVIPNEKLFTIVTADFDFQNPPKNFKSIDYDRRNFAVRSEKSINKYFYDEALWHLNFDKNGELFGVLIQPDEGAIIDTDKLKGSAISSDHKYYYLRNDKKLRFNIEEPTHKISTSDFSWNAESDVGLAVFNMKRLPIENFKNYGPDSDFLRLVLVDDDIEKIIDIKTENSRPISLRYVSNQSGGFFVVFHSKGDLDKFKNLGNDADEDLYVLSLNNNLQVINAHHFGGAREQTESLSNSYYPQNIFKRKLFRNVSYSNQFFNESVAIHYEPFYQMGIYEEWDTNYGILMGILAFNNGDSSIIFPPKVNRPNDKYSIWANTKLQFNFLYSPTDIKSNSYRKEGIDAFDRHWHQWFGLGDSLTTLGLWYIEKTGDNTMTQKIFKVNRVPTGKVQE